MRDEQDAADQHNPPPASEHVHLPEPSYLPALVAAGITIALVGIVLTWVVVALGVILFLIPTILWIRDVRSDISELPLNH
jgi:hypothetical protein